MENHFAVTHTKSKDKWKCQLCSKDYCTLESFKAHYKGYCKPPMANLGSVLSEESGDRDAMQVDETSKQKESESEESSSSSSSSECSECDEKGEKDKSCDTLTESQSTDTSASIHEQIFRAVYYYDVFLCVVKLIHNRHGQIVLLGCIPVC